MLLNLIFNSGDPLTGLLLFVLIALALVISLSIHEFSHAYVANELGDPTAKSLGRITLDPRSHLDPVGTLMLLLVGFGWGRPVPFDPHFLKNPKRDSALIALAGPMSNIVLALLFAGVFHIFSLGGLLGLFVQLVVQYNLVLAIFNLIPVNPLDGFKVVNGILPRELSYQWAQLAPYGMWILLILIFTGVTERIIFPLMELSLTILGF